MSNHGTKRDMPYVRLGNSGLKVSRLILGCMTYGDADWQGWVLDEKAGIEHIKAAFDAGINAFDTADVYSHGESERILGKAIKQHSLPRDEIVVLTKLYSPLSDTVKRVIRYSNPDDYGFVNQHGLSRKHIFDSVKASLERLQLEYIDVLQCHRFDYNTPVEETMQALHDVVKAGHVRYIGMSSCFAWQFWKMQSYAVSHGLTPFITMQNHYNLLYREEEREMMPTLKHFGVGSIPWSPLARGLICRPFADASSDRQKTDAAAEYLYRPDDYKAIVDAAETVAKARNITMAQVALAWVLSKEQVSAPIVGTTSLNNLHDLIKAIHIKLTDDEITSLEAGYKPMPVSGHS